MRQAGILAAAGIYALNNNIDRLAEDHDNAQKLGSELAEIEQLDVNLEFLHTNMVFLKAPASDVNALSAFLEQQGILVDALKNLRLVTHMHITQDDVGKVVEAFKTFYSK